MRSHLSMCDLPWAEDALTLARDVRVSESLAFSDRARSTCATGSRRPCRSTADDFRLAHFFAAVARVAAVILLRFMRARGEGWRRAAVYLWPFPVRSGAAQDLRAVPYLFRSLERSWTHGRFACVLSGVCVWSLRLRVVAKAEAAKAEALQCREPATFPKMPRGLER